jgi:hypothetical protein
LTKITEMEGVVTDLFHKEWLTTTDLGRLMGGITNQTIRVWCNSKDRANRVPDFVKRPDGEIRFHRKAVEAFFRGQGKILDQMIRNLDSGFRMD